MVLAIIKGGKEKKNTANCYIVDSKGTYQFPLVYGNAITNDIDYSDSSYTYKGAGTGDNYLKTFRNYKDRANGEAAPGLYRFNWNTQACFQYMPTKDRNFRLFAHYSYYSRHSTAHGRDIGIASLDRQAVTAGIIYIMKIF